MTTKKPLELTIHTQCTCKTDTEPHYADEDGTMFWVAENAADAKHFTDTELAAQLLWTVFHESECEVRGRKLAAIDPEHPGIDDWAAQNREYARQAPIVERFATRPHAHESDYQ